MTETERYDEVSRLADLYPEGNPVTETERYVNVTCQRIVASGHVRLYMDLYKDLRERLPCGVACRLVAAGLRATRCAGYSDSPALPSSVMIQRASAIAALERLERFDRRRLHPFDPRGGRIVGRDA